MTLCVSLKMIPSDVTAFLTIMEEDANIITMNVNNHQVLSAHMDKKQFYEFFSPIQNA